MNYPAMEDLSETARTSRRAFVKAYQSVTTKPQTEMALLLVLRHIHSQIVEITHCFSVFVT
jgi:hypothetical protein